MRNRVLIQEVRKNAPRTLSLSCLGSAGIIRGQLQEQNALSKTLIIVTICEIWLAGTDTGLSTTLSAAPQDWTDEALTTG